MNPKENPQSTIEPRLPARGTDRLSHLAAWFDPGEPHPYRGPFTRWPGVSDGVLAVAVFLASLIAVAASAIEAERDFTATIGDLPAGSLALLALASGALWWRRAHAIGVTTVVLVLMIVWALAGYGDGHELALIVAGYSVGRYTTNHNHSVLAVVAIAMVDIVGTLIDSNQRIDIAPAVIVAVLPWYIGRLVRNRGEYLVLLRERAERLEAEQHARARQAVAEERSRIARELHDVVAHQVSMMTVQAGAAKTVARDDLDAAIEAMSDVERAGRQALGELRHLLGVLRPDTADPDHLGPQPALTDIPALADDLTHTGADVTLNLADLSEDISAAVELSAYRIVQESLTNIIKHAGPDPAVVITIAFEDSALVIDIVNTAATAAHDLPPSGYGITGMMERATLLGGTLTAGPLPPNRYRVHARLPLEPDPT
ncbi:MAG: sensor histidine kinase [Acidimicrobiales bacterium]